MFIDRVRGLGLVFIVALVVIFGRVVHLQLGLGPWHRATMAEGDVQTRPIRAPRGSIFASDGSLLAADRCDADLTVHYRYLERPLDDAWLERQAAERLSRRDRRDPEVVARVKNEIRDEIQGMWQALAGLTDVPLAELDRRASVAQRRVERIVQSVNRRRRERWEQRREEQANRETATRSDNSNSQSSFAFVERFCNWLSDDSQRPSSNTPPAPIAVVEQDRFYTLIENISPKVLLEYTDCPERFPGVRLEQRIRRVYPRNALACAVIGYIEPQGVHSDSDDAELSSGEGRTGVEGFYEKLLAGVPGHVREMVGPRGGAPRALGGRPPQPGQDITLTLDLRLQQFAEESLTRALEQAADAAHHVGQASSGAIVALDVHTGAVLVAASAPQFDLNVAAQPGSDDARALTERSDAPLFNRVAQMTLAPGSTFKPVTAVAALKSGFDISETYLCRGYLHRPDRFRCSVFRNAGVGHDSVTMHDALVRSCNVYFFQLAERLGSDPILQWADAFGFGQRTGIDLAGEQHGTLPGLSARNSPNQGRSGSVAKNRSPVRPANRTEGDALGLAIGQGRVEATPLQVAVMMAAIANGGLKVVPHVRRDAFQPPQQIPGFQPYRDRTLEQVRQALEQVVSDPRGTGHEEVHMKDIEIAGKTGTAQSGSPLGDHAWFAGYAPAKNPRVAMVVVLEHAGSGAHAAGPLARDLIRRMVELDYFPDVMAAPGRHSQAYSEPRNSRP
jgi:penicillin-binding protein 2